jgi:hypothetical protein
MSNKHRPTYDSQRDRDNYTFHPGRLMKLTWDPEPGKCCLYVLSDRQAAMLRKMVQVIPKYQWVWGLPSPRAEWDQATQNLWEDISTLVEETEACLVSDCDLTEFNANLDRIATAVEGLNDKAGAFYSVQDFLDDLADTLGVGSTIYQFLNAIWGLFPRLALKIDATPLAMSAWEYLAWKAPILTLLGSIAGSQTVIAASTAGSSAIAIITAVGAFWGNLFFNLQDIVLGNTSLWNDYLLPLWRRFQPSIAGGTGGDDPDNDPTLRAVINAEVMATIQQICCEAVLPDGVNPTNSPAIPPIDNLPSDGTSGTDPSNPFIDYDLGFGGNDKCDVAYWIVDTMDQYSRNPNWEQLLNIAGGLNMSVAAAAIVVIVLAVEFPLVMPAAALGVLAAALVTAWSTGGAGIVGLIGQAIQENRDDLICALYTAGNTTQAKSQFRQVLIDAGLDGPVIEVIVAFLSNATLNLLFWASTEFPIPDQPEDCAECSPCPPIIWTLDQTTEGWLWSDESDAPSNASASYDQPNGEYDITLNMAPESSNYARVVFTKSMVGNNIVAGDSLEIDFTDIVLTGPCTQVSQAMSIRVRAVLEDEQFEQVTKTHVDNMETLTFQFSIDGALNRFEIEVRASTSAECQSASQFAGKTSSITEIRANLSNC